MGKKKKYALTIAILISFIFASVSFACYIKNRGTTSDGVVYGYCSNNGEAVKCAPSDNGNLWVCLGPAGQGIDVTFEEASRKSCGCD